MIKATYTATRPDRDPEVLAENIAREQSLELTRALIPDDIAERLLGQVVSIEQLDEQRWRLEIGYPVELASGQVGQLLHLVYGNISYYPRVRLTALDLPETLLRDLAGPRAGIPGIRDWTGVADRALLATVLKPRGASAEVLAEQALRFARGGGDLVKDDQNLVEREIDDFRNRIMLCSQAIENATDYSGRKCLYLPHVAGSGDFLRAQLEVVAELGLGGVVTCPWVMGLETAATAAREFGLMWLAHPAVAGTMTESDDRGIAADVLLGTLVRAAGADISIYPGRGGRISTVEGEDSKIHHALTEPLGSLKPTLPCTGGGKTLDQVPETARELGPDCAILVGGDLLSRGRGLEQAVRETIEELVGES